MRGFRHKVAEKRGHALKKQRIFKNCKIPTHSATKLNLITPK